MAGDPLAIQRHFFRSPYYAVAGASTNPSKFGYRLLDWYASRNIPVVPVTPSSDSVLNIKAVPDIEHLDADKLGHTSLSIVTPPKVSLGILKQALEKKELNGLWLQPGAEDDQVEQFITSNEWLRERTVYGGPCVLVAGDRLRKEAQEKL